LLGQEGHDKEAETWFRSAVAANPRFAPAWVNLAATLASESRFGEAWSAIEAALKVDPNDAEALRLRQMLPASTEPSQSPAAARDIRPQQQP
jgi:Flp pilus assembly protein TadD